MRNLSIEFTNRMIMDAVSKVRLRHAQEDAIARMASFWPEPRAGKWEDMGWSNDDDYRRVMGEALRRNGYRGW